MMVGIALISAAYLVVSAAEIFEQITPEAAAERVSQCGLGPVTIRYDDLLQSEILTAASAASASDEQLVCADKAVSFYDLELPPAVQSRYDSIREARLSVYFLAEARAWLSARGLLDRVPKYEPGVTDEAAFTRQVEELCGPRAKGAFRLEYGFHAISPAWAQPNLLPIEEGSEVFACLTNVTTVAGFEVGFIGNEAYAPD
jgi:hypothetical protein